MSTIVPSPASPQSTRSRLQSLLGAFDVETFLREHLGTKMLHVSQAIGDASDLISWDDLNRLLNSGLVPYPRARLIAQGKPVDMDTYTHESAGHRWLDSARTERKMRDGATLIVLAIDQVTPRLAALVRDLEFELQASLDLSVVATFTSVPGLAMHWDTRECFNIQIAGEKHWRIVPPSRRHPLSPTRRFPKRTDITRDVTPTGDDTWSGIVRPGDVLYFPRGWWHAVTPHVTPSLHLSIAIDIPTFADFLTWYVDDCKRHESVRRVIPTWRSADERRGPVEKTFAEIVNGLTSNALESYLAFVEASTQPLQGVY